MNDKATYPTSQRSPKSYDFPGDVGTGGKSNSYITDKHRLASDLYLRLG